MIRLSDRMYASIKIPVKYLKDPDVRKKIMDEFYGDEDIEDWAEDISDGVACFSNEEQRYGEFRHLEDYLEERKIPFDRFTSAYYACGEIYLSYRPEYGNFVETGEDGRQIPCRKIRKLLEEHDGDCADFRNALIKLLDEEYDPCLKELKEY